MSKPDYTALDAAILAAIKEKQPAMFHVFAYDGDVNANSLALVHTEKNGDSWRVTDRRLQALRRAGQVHYQRKPEGWVIATPSRQSP